MVFQEDCASPLMKHNQLKDDKVCTTAKFIQAFECGLGYRPG